jgi:hypothetical protein
MLPPHASKFGVVANEVGKLPALLHQVAARKTLDFLLKAPNSQQFAQDKSGVIKAQRLIEIGRQQVVFRMQ